jgi:hypothetical protein
MAMEAVTSLRFSSDAPVTAMFSELEFGSARYLGALQDRILPTKVECSN